MSLLYQLRCRKLRLVCDVLGYAHPLDLLFAYRLDPVVPGVCLTEHCTHVKAVERRDYTVLCPECGEDSIASVCVLAGIE